MTSPIELMQAHVLNRYADAAELFVHVMVASGTGLKEFESATFGMRLQVGLELLNGFGQMQGDGDHGGAIRDPAPAPAGAPKVTSKCSVQREFLRRRFRYESYRVGSLRTIVL